MPTYEYSCAKCGHHFEKFQSMNDHALKVCPKELCKLTRWGRGRVKRQVGSGAGLIFKGSGFYITDYRSEGYKESAKKDTAPAAPSGGEHKPAAESKPAAPKPAAPKSESKHAKPKH
ncbi:MAG TPA: FmdB family zinc ribbon protein [Verrucomicrobiae bacterium]|jgi:putative FmdB family regulatory protein